ncbi:MAG TPA: response regulator [Spirochaetota bacterium]|nr:response regulator [Spirochaetota bacterium]
MARTVLVVEDNEANRALLRDILTHRGYEVIEAVNGEEGVRTAAERLPDIILMDMQMPVMNGFKAIELIKNDPRTAHINIVAVTSFAMAVDRRKVMASGADEYISKPFDTRELPRIIERLLAPPLGGGREVYNVKDD